MGLGIFDSGGQDSYVSKELIPYASWIADQRYNLSTLSGTATVTGKVIGFEMWHHGMNQYIPISALISPDSTGSSMRIKRKQVAIPIDIARKYNITIETEGINDIDRFSGRDENELLVDLGGVTASILLGQDADFLQPKRVEGILDDKGSLSVYQLVHKEGFILGGRGRELKSIHNYHVLTGGLPEVASIQNTTSNTASLMACNKLISNFVSLKSAKTPTDHSLCIRKTIVQSRSIIFKSSFRAC